MIAATGALLKASITYEGSLTSAPGKIGANWTH